MPVVTLKDGAKHSFEQPVSVMAVAESIGPGLAKAALAGKVNGKLVDCDFSIDHDVDLGIITSDGEEGLSIIRHSTAHLMAMAVQDLFPDAQVTIGPVITDGFYYDFAYKRGFTPEDLVTIEMRMEELVKQDIPIQRQIMDRLDVIQYFRSKGESYKVEIISDLPPNEDISLYKQGDWMDLCRGPHVPSTGKLKTFKLMRVAGAYWRGDSNNEMLSRIYGTAWANKKTLRAYLTRLEEAEKRDHRKIGKRLKLFHTQEEAPGMVFWHPNGWMIYQIIRRYMREQQRKHRYQEVNTPQLLDRTLWEKSGHWDKFHGHMFTTSSESRDIAIKPMNCPCHVQIFKQSIKSYRDLPFRMAEFGACHRNEPSGALHGIMRVRAFTQDDGHIFIEKKDILPEVVSFIDFLHQVYSDFGFNKDDLSYKISTRPQERVGDDMVWDYGEKALKEALNSKGLPWDELLGEGAFYGPKIEFVLRDCIGRLWQCGTIQVDFSMPERLGARYVDSDGNQKTPVMLHRAILGSFERFIGILIEHYEGGFPLWLAPTQVVIFGVTDRQNEYVLWLEQEFSEKEVRISVDLRSEKVGFKIREHTLAKIPYQIIVGDKEQSLKTVSVRARIGNDLGMMEIDEFISKLTAEKYAVMG